MRVSDYPVPQYACYIWHRGDGLVVSWPDGGTVFLPQDKLASHGFEVLLGILAERRRLAQEKKPAGIGTSAEPTQLMLEALMRGAKVQRKAKHTDEDVFAEEFDAP